MAALHTIRHWRLGASLGELSPVVTCSRGLARISGVFELSDARSSASTILAGLNRDTLEARGCFSGSRPGWPYVFMLDRLSAENKGVGNADLDILRESYEIAHSSNINDGLRLSSGQVRSFFMPAKALPGCI